MSSTNLIRKIIKFFNLESELEDADVIYEEIRNGIIFKGTKLWILIFAIIIASVGLNMNSTAVIIGAMLISPLMGPINGIGYSIATYDFDLFKSSIKNFSFAIIASLVASTTYFAITPVSTAQSELLARTSPTFYDVIIALFGGFAGIVAISSKFKGNVIPGVAIATALMPPLCTSGYGIATGQFKFFFGAFYLFTINSIFIAFASVWVSQILKFPIRREIDPAKKKNINRVITIIITLVLLPSIFFGYNLVKEERFIQNSNKYISNISVVEGNYLLKHEIIPSEQKIVLVYGGSALNDEQKKNIINKAKDFNLEKADIFIEQGLRLDKVSDLTLERFKLKEQLNNLSSAISERDAKLDSIAKKEKFGQGLLGKLKTIYPQIKGGVYSESFYYHDSLSSPLKMHILVLDTKTIISKKDKNKILEWAKKRLNSSDVRIIFN